MCADFAIHDKGTGNPHVHIMLTLRPLKENGQWGAKCRKAYDLDENGQRIPDGKGGWKNHREDTTDWNDKGNVEIWRAAWAAYTNRALESAGRPERIDHRSYKRQGIDKIPSVHLGPAASQMEKRGIRTDKGEVNRQIAADNKLLKEIKARITRLYNWSKAEAEKPEGQQPSMIDLWEARQQLKRPDTRTGKIRALQEIAALFSFLQANGIQSMQQLHEKIADMNTRYYDLRREIVKAERRIAVLTERGEMWAQYNEYKAIHKQLARMKPEKRELFEQRHSRELILYDAADRYLKELKASGEELSPKEWRREIDLLTAQKQVDTIDMKAMREELKACLLYTSPTNSDDICTIVKKSPAAEQAPSGSQCENCHNVTEYRVFCARIASCCPGVFSYLWGRNIGPTWPEPCPRCRSPPPRSDFFAKI